MTDALWKLLNEADDHQRHWSADAWRQWFVQVVDATSGVDNALERASEAAEAERSRLLAGLQQLREYVQHKPTCPRWINVKLDLGPGWVSHSEVKPCSCGLDALIAEVAPRPTYSREEFERDSKGETGDKLAEAARLPSPEEPAR